MTSLGDSNRKGMTIKSGRASQEEFNILYSSANKAREMKSKNLIWAAHVVKLEDKKSDLSVF